MTGHQVAHAPHARVCARANAHTRTHTHTLTHACSLSLSHTHNAHGRAAAAGRLVPSADNAAPLDHTLW